MGDSDQRQPSDENQQGGSWAQHQHDCNRRQQQKELQTIAHRQRGMHEEADEQQRQDSRHRRAWLDGEHPHENKENCELRRNSQQRQAGAPFARLQWHFNCFSY